MTAFVLDNSVAMRWILETERAADQTYAENVLRSLPHITAIVPNLWHLEASNVLCLQSAASFWNMAKLKRS